jgi:predicted GTPase
MPVEQLKVLYQSKFSYEYVFQLMSAVHAGTIDWWESLKNEWINNLWRTIFTFTMM